MSLKSILTDSLLDNPGDWSICEHERFLTNGDVRLVRNSSSDRWHFIVGDIGQVKLPIALHMRIEWMRRGMRFISAQ